MSVALADRDHGVAHGHRDGRARPYDAGGPSSPAGDRGGSRRGSHRAAGTAVPPPPEERAAAATTTIDFLREEVVEICAALALAGSLLRRLGLGAESSRVEALFGAVEERLGGR